MNARRLCASICIPVVAAAMGVLVTPSAALASTRSSLPIFKQGDKDGCTVRESTADDVGVYCASYGGGPSQFQAVTMCDNGHYAFSPVTPAGFTAYASCKETQSSTVRQPFTWIVKHGDFS